MGRRTPTSNGVVDAGEIDPNNRDDDVTVTDRDGDGLPNDRDNCPDERQLRAVRSRRRRGRGRLRR
jgi:hypothetical protein